MQEADPRTARERAKAHARLGDVLMRGARVEEAEHAFRAAVELHPDHYEAWAKLARALDRLGRSDEAAAAREQEAAALRRAGRELGR
jgi:Flp pilus assembly protein TadD